METSVFKHIPNNTTIHFFLMFERIIQISSLFLFCRLYHSLKTSTNSLRCSKNFRKWQRDITSFMHIGKRLLTKWEFNAIHDRIFFFFGKLNFWIFTSIFSLYKCQRKYNLLLFYFDLILFWVLQFYCNFIFLVLYLIYNL